MTLAMAFIVPVLAVIAQAPGTTEGQPPAQIAGAENVAEQIACAPMSLAAPPLAGMRIIGGAAGRIMFAPGDGVVINAGTRQGLKAGQQYYVRRFINDKFTPASLDFTPVSVHTAGWVTIVDAKDETSIAQVTHACDGMLLGDYLDPFTDPVVPQPALGGSPDYEHPARIVMADQTMQTAAAGMLMLLNRGSDHGVRAGQTLTIFRPTMAGAGPVVDVGRATILSVRPQTSLMRIDSSRDAVYVGDLAAIHRIQ
jgi:hypothetical protein